MSSDIVGHAQRVDQPSYDVDQELGRRRGSVPAGPDHLDVAEPLGLVELDDALLEQLEQRRGSGRSPRAARPDRGQPAERDAADPRQLVEQLGDGVGDAGAHRGDVEQVDRVGTGFGVTRRRYGGVEALAA